MVQKAKVGQTCITFLLVGSSCVSFAAGSAEFGAIMATSAFSAFACTMLYVAGNLFSRVIGFIYIDPQQQQVKIAHLNFWGNREEEIVDISDIMPVSDTNDRLSTPFIRIERLSEIGRVYYVTTRYGDVKDRDAFEEVFKFRLDSIDRG